MGLAADHRVPKRGLHGCQVRPRQVRPRRRSLCRKVSSVRCRLRRVTPAAPRRDRAPSSISAQPLKSASRFRNRFLRDRLNRITAAPMQSSSIDQDRQSVAALDTVASVQMSSAIAPKGDAGNHPRAGAMDQGTWHGRGSGHWAHPTCRPITQFASSVIDV